MRLDVFHSPTHQKMFDTFLKPSATMAGLNVIEHHAPDDLCPSSHEWTSDGMIEMGLWARSRLAFGGPCTNEIRMTTGCDIVFFKPFAEWAKKFMDDGGYDIAFQDDNGVPCQDFQIYRDTLRTRVWFFSSALVVFDSSNSKTIDKSKRLAWINDQVLLCKFIKKQTLINAQTSIGIIPRDIVCNFPHCAGRDDKLWEPGIEFDIPKSAMAFHANWTVGEPNKMKMLEYAKRKGGAA